jgi:curved DNA-binding protein CbpA
MNGARDVYLVLQVDPSADPIVIKAAYRALARRYHPDGAAPDAARMSEINRAYALLIDPDLRRRHDEGRAGSSTLRQAASAGPRPAPVPFTPASSGTLDFGRYMGWRIADLARHDPDYLRWLARHSSGIRYRELIARVLAPEPDPNRRASSVR